jgi:glucose-6-phosphate isomerase
MNSIPVKNLKAHTDVLKSLSLKKLFDEDLLRFEKFSAEVQSVLVDYSKNYLTSETFELLMSIAKECNVPQALSKLNAGEVVNLSENRPALHSALRKPKSERSPEIQETLERIEKYINTIHNSHYTDIVNIGIGGSDLGPHMASLALSPYAVTSQKLHFVSTLDAYQIDQILKVLDPEKTLFIISSKSFTTEETKANADIAKKWLGKDFVNQMVAVTANKLDAKKFGILDKNIFPIWEWIGGRYSIWSAIGLPLAIKIGMKNFEDFLSGGYAIDQHVLETPLEKNIPVILGLLNVLYTNFFEAQTHAILPYDIRLSRFPAYLQQLEMESNGKSVTQHNENIHYQTGPIIWGEVGTNGQHAFHQLLHQGTQFIPVDFIIAKKPHHAFPDQHQLLISHCLSQARALMIGEASDLLYKELTGNRPSTMIVLPELSPFYLGLLIALYEYKVFVSSVIWDINPFDQWGVELGKKMAKDIYQELKQFNENNSKLDLSTKNLLKRVM